MSPLRQACDRCHSIKTRCVKSQRQHNCVRCERLGVQCVYSQPVKTGRPLGSSKAKQQAAQKQDSSPTTQQQQQTSGSYAESTPYIESPISASLSTSGSDFFQSLSEGSISAQSWDDEDIIFPPPTSINDFDVVNSTLFANNPMMDFFDVHHTTPASLMQTPSMNPVDPLLGLGEHTSVDRSMAGVPGQEDKWLHYFTELQSRLTRLFRNISTSENVLVEAEQLYEATQILELAAGGKQPTTQDSTAPQFGCRAMPSWPPSGVAVLLLSSCYYTLMHAYSSLIQKLQQELRHCSSSSSLSSSSSSSSSSSKQQQQKRLNHQPSSPPSDPDSFEQQSIRSNSTAADLFSDRPNSSAKQCLGGFQAPSLLVGSVPMRLSRQASLELNLFLAVQTLRRTRESVQKSIAKASAGSGGSQQQQQHQHQTPQPRLHSLPSPATDTPNGSPRVSSTMSSNDDHNSNKNTATESMWNSLETDGLFTGSGLGDRAEAALTELRLDEEKMFARLGSSMFMFN